MSAKLDKALFEKLYIEKSKEIADKIDHEVITTQDLLILHLLKQTIDLLTRRM